MSLISQTSGVATCSCGTQRQVRIFITAMIISMQTRIFSNSPTTFSKQDHSMTNSPGKSTREPITPHIFRTQPRTETTMDSMGLPLEIFLLESVNNYLEWRQVVSVPLRLAVSTSLSRPPSANSRTKRTHTSTGQSRHTPSILSLLQFGRSARTSPPLAWTLPRKIRRRSSRLPRNGSRTFRPSPNLRKLGLQP